MPIALRGTSIFVLILAPLFACTASEEPPPGDAAVNDAGRATNDAAPAADAETIRDADETRDAELDGGAADEGVADTGEADSGENDSGESDSGVPAVFTLISSAFVEGAMIPPDHACPDPDVQPELEWMNPPAGTMSYVLVLIDDTIDFTHWVAYNIPATTTSLPQAASDDGLLPAGAEEAMAYCRRYCGPCPGNQHQYTFRVYALDVATINFTLSGRIDGADLQMALGANTLGLATLTGTYTP